MFTLKGKMELQVLKEKGKKKKKICSELRVLAQHGLMPKKGKMELGVLKEKVKYSSQAYNLK